MTHFVKTPKKPRPVAVVTDTYAALATVNNAVNVTDGSGVRSFSTTLPAVDGSAVTGVTTPETLVFRYLNFGGF